MEIFHLDIFKLQWGSLHPYGALYYFLIDNSTVWEELVYKQVYHVKSSLVICATQPASGVLLKKLKYFKAMLNIFKFSRV